MSIISRTSIAAIAILIMFPFSARAVTLGDALSMALDAEAARSAIYESEAIEADARGSAAFTLPQISLSGSYLWMGTNAQETAFIQYPDENLTGRVEGSQLLWAGGRIINSHRLKSSLIRGAQLTERERMRDIKRDVRVAFYRVLHQKALLGILMDRVLQREDELEDARALREVGMVTSLDVRQAQLLRNTALEDLRAQEAEYETALIAFNLALGRSGGDELLLPDGELARAPEISALLGSAKAALAEKTLLDLRAAQNGLSSSEYEKKMATGEFFPEVTLVGSAESVKEGIFQEGESWTAGVQLRWSVFDGGLKRARRSAADANLKLAGEFLSLEGKRLAGVVREMEARARSLDERIVLQEEALKLSEENYADARAHYRVGTITQTRLGEFNLAYAEARFGLKRLYFLEQQLLAELMALLEGT